ncbi:MAG: hypothetical protein E6G70_13465 [Alphaproteobacteria bacterium]|nr:MAG: hypothetical protein E6G70_13465 [Alphaproteobacteria bacterium]
MPWSKSFTFTDPYPYQAALRISDVEIFPTAKGKFCAELMQINLNKLWMQRGRENLPHVVAGTSQARSKGDFVSYQRTGDGVLRPTSFAWQHYHTENRRPASAKWS